MKRRSRFLKPVSSISKVWSPYSHFLKKRIRQAKYEAILGLEYKYPIWLLCEIAGVSKTAYHRYKRKPSKPSDSDDHIEELVVSIHKKSGRKKGYRSIKLSLRNDHKIIVNHKKVLRIMRENKIFSILTKKSKRTREQSIIKQDLLKRDFSSDVPGKKFVTDITYIPTRRKMVYLCTVIDLYNNEPVAWNISDTQDKFLSIKTIKMLAEKVDLSGSIIHSDQGVHYTNLMYVDLLQKLNVKQSMSRKGNCWDNAQAESFFGHYKSETIHLLKRRLKDINEVTEITEAYMDYYINDRPQKKLGGYPPGQYKSLKLSA